VSAPSTKLILPQGEITSKAGPAATVDEGLWRHLGSAVPLADSTIIAVLGLMGQK
jgi:hypothetical protein